MEHMAILCFLGLGRNVMGESPDMLSCLNVDHWSICEELGMKSNKLRCISPTWCQSLAIMDNVGCKQGGHQ